MQDQTTTTLMTVLSKVLADLAFMFADNERCAPPVSERWLETAISYEGSPSGTLRLTCTRTFATQLAVNLLGLETGEETTEQESDDAVKEFMNVLCGQYVTAAFGAEDVFHLMIPELLKRPTAPEFGDPEEPLEDVALLSVDGQWLHLRHQRNR